MARGAGSGSGRRGSGLDSAVCLPSGSQLECESVFVHLRPEAAKVSALGAHCLGLTLAPQFESGSDTNSVALANLIFWASRFPACKMRLLQHLNHGVVVRVS